MPYFRHKSGDLPVRQAGLRHLGEPFLIQFLIEQAFQLLLNQSKIPL